MKKLLILAMILPLAGCNLFGSDDDKKSPPVVVQPSDPVTPEEPPVEEEPVNETREEMIERELNLPPEPDEAENNATILGVDVNENNIRDDVERKIAFEFYDEPNSLKIQMHYADLWTQMINANGNQDVVFDLTTEIRKLVQCNTLDVEDEDEIASIINRDTAADWLLNIVDRWSAYAKASKLKRPVLSPTDEEIRTYCSQFNN